MSALEIRFVAFPESRYFKCQTGGRGCANQGRSPDLTEGDPLYVTRKILLLPNVARPVNGLGRHVQLLAPLVFRQVPRLIHHATSYGANYGRPSPLPPPTRSTT